MCVCACARVCARACVCVDLCHSGRIRGRVNAHIICYVCGPHTHVIRDYKSSNPRVNIGLALLLYVCVAHTHEPNPKVRDDSGSDSMKTNSLFIFPSPLHLSFEESQRPPEKGLIFPFHFPPNSSETSIIASSPLNSHRNQKIIRLCDPTLLQ